MAFQPDQLCMGTGIGIFVGFGVIVGFIYTHLASVMKIIVQ